MAFERFGSVSFTSETKAQDFVGHLEKGQVMATKCKKCGRIYFPPRMDCADDFSSDMDWVPVQGKGRLLSYTIVSYGPTGFENETPYVLAVADFSGVKVFGRLDKQIPAAEIKVGMDVTVSAQELPAAADAKAPAAAPGAAPASPVKKLTYQFKKA